MLDALEKWSTASGDFDEERGKQQKMQQTEKKQKTVDSKEDDKEEKRRSSTQYPGWSKINMDNVSFAESRLQKNAWMHFLKFRPA